MTDPLTKSEVLIPHGVGTSNVIRKIPLFRNQFSEFALSKSRPSQAGLKVISKLKKTNLIITKTNEKATAVV